MSREERVELLGKIGNERSSHIISYITGDRKPFTTQIADDAVQLLRKHLDALPERKTIGLFLYSRGGDMIVPLRIVRLIREYCDKFEVLIPYRAHSAATLISLGADNLVLGKQAELSPVDPTTGHPFNPIDPSDKQKEKRVPISVEDLTSYFLLAKERAGVRDEQMVDIFRALTDKIHPLSLGNIFRGHRAIRLLSKKLLELHMDAEKDKHKIDMIVKKVTDELCIHGYFISREEAEKDLEMCVEKPDDKLESLLWKLYEEYEDEMKLKEPFDSSDLVKEDESKIFSYIAAYIESVNRTDGFLFQHELKRVKDEKGIERVALNIVNPPKWVVVYPDNSGR